MITLTYTIPLPPVTKKNSQQILINRKTGKPFITPSKAYKDYEAKAGWYLKPRPIRPIYDPVEVVCVFYMATRRAVDLTNLLEAADDMLVANGILGDDNSTVIKSHDGSRVKYDKENPRTEITIKEFEEEDYVQIHA